MRRLRHRKVPHRWVKKNAAGENRTTPTAQKRQGPLWTKGSLAHEHEARFVHPRARRTVLSVLRRGGPGQSGRRNPIQVPRPPEQVRAEVLRTLQSLAVDGLVDQISNANLAITIGKEHPELRPTQSCMSWATGELEKRGEIAKIVNFIPGTRMRQPNGYRLTVT